MVTTKIYLAFKTLIPILAFAIASGYSNVATAFCMEPSAPGFRPEKPSVPWCVDEYAGTHTCDEWEIDSYYAEISSYNSEVSDYVSQLNAYIDEAVAYAQCEVANLE
jgi:hypothetical protein